MITLIYALIMIMIIVITIIINNNNNKGHWRDPWLKRRIENDIKNLRKDINLLGRDERREPRLVIERLKERWIVKKASIESCKQRVFKFRQNLLFEVSQTQSIKNLMASYEERESNSKFCRDC